MMKKTSLGAIFTYQPKSIHKAGEGLEQGAYPFFTSSNIQSKFLDTFDFNGEFLIFGTGGNASVNYVNGKFSTSTDNFIVKVNANVKFVYHYLKANINLLEDGFRGASIKHISKKYINNIKLLLPSFPEQQRIATELDIVCGILARQKEQHRLFDELIKSKFIEMFGDPILNDFKWNEVSFQELGNVERGVSKHRPRNAPELLGGKYPLIQTGEIAGSDLYIKKYTATYSDIGLKQSRIWKQGTLCITIAANIAKTAILGFDACFPDSVVGFQANEKTLPIFIHFWFSFFQKLLEEQAPESAQKNINLQTLRNLKVIVPPVSLQQQFIDFVNQVEKSKGKLKAEMEQTETLYKALMQRYFE